MLDFIKNNLSRFNCAEKILHKYMFHVEKCSKIKLNEKQMFINDILKKMEKEKLQKFLNKFIMLKNENNLSYSQAKILGEYIKSFFSLGALFKLLTLKNFPKKREKKFY